MILLSLSSCLHKPLPEPGEIDPEIKPYIQMFENEYGKSLGRLTVQFAPTLDNASGMCLQHWRSVVIKKEHWDKYNGLQREQLIFHELGHCVLGIRGHNNNMTDYCPDSIMHENIFNEWQSENCYAEDRDYYIAELFNRL
jgi:hypothetical protein